jgi:hypothetical protein
MLTGYTLNTVLLPSLKEPQGIFKPYHIGVEE